MIQISPCKLMRQIKIHVCSATSSQMGCIWWVNRDDTPLPGEMSRVKLSTLVWDRLGGKSPTSTASESFLGIFGLSTNSTHKTRPEKLLKEESRAWNPGDFYLQDVPGFPSHEGCPSESALHLAQKDGAAPHGAATWHPPAQAQHIPARNKQASSCTHTRTGTHTRAG